MLYCRCFWPKQSSLVINFIFAVVPFALSLFPTVIWSLPVSFACSIYSHAPPVPNREPSSLDQHIILHHLLYIHADLLLTQFTLVRRVDYPPCLSQLLPSPPWNVPLHLVTLFFLFWGLDFTLALLPSLCGSPLEELFLQSSTHTPTSLKAVLCLFLVSLKAKIIK